MNDNQLNVLIKDSFKREWNKTEDDREFITRDFDRRMKLLIENSVKTKKEKRLRCEFLLLKRALAAVFALVFLLNAAVISVNAQRETTAEFKMGITPYGLLIRSVPNDENDLDKYSKIETTYLPQLPQSYKKTYRFLNDEVFMVNFENDSNNFIEYSQRLLTTTEYLKSNQYNVQRFTYSDIDYLFFTSNGKNILLWNELGYSFSLSSDVLTREQLKSFSITLDKES